MVSQTHPLAESPSLSLDDLQHQRLALPAQGLQARNKFDTLLQNRNLDLNICLEINDVNELVHLVRDSRLVTILSTATISQADGVVAIPLKGVDSSMEGSYHFLKGAYKKVAVKEFLRILCESKNYGMAQMEVLV